MKPRRPGSAARDDERRATCCPPAPCPLRAGMPSQSTEPPGPLVVALESCPCSLGPFNWPALLSQAGTARGPEQPPLLTLTMSCSVSKSPVPTIFPVTGARMAGTSRKITSPPPLPLSSPQHAVVTSLSSRDCLPPVRCGRCAPGESPPHRGQTRFLPLPWVRRLHHLGA